MQRNRSPSAGIRRLWARLAQRDRWPRCWWWPQPAGAPEALDAEAYRKRHAAISDAIRYAMYGLFAFGLFCALTLGTPDSQLLAGASKIPVPFANTQIDFATFVVVGPLCLVAYACYLHIFVGQLRRLPPLAELERPVALFNFAGRLPGLLSYLAFYWLAPAVILTFAYKAAPTAAGTWLMFVATVFALVLLWLQLRRNALGEGRGARLLLWALIAVVMIAPIRILWWSYAGGERPFRRAWDLERADLSGVNLIGADLEGAIARGADLHGSDLTKARLRGADLANADLSSAVLHGADLREADLDGAKLRATDLKFANLRYASVRDADLEGAWLAPEQLRGLCFDATTQFSPDARPDFAPGGCANGTRTRKRPAMCDTAPKTPAVCDHLAIRRIVSPVGGYAVACLRTCDAYYVDRGRTHTLARIPRELEGATWIKTTNTGDKNETAETFLQFQIEPPAMVYVGYDSRITRGDSAPPDWLVRNFEPTGLVIGLNEPDQRQDFVVYAKAFTQPMVTLGGNRASGSKSEEGEGSNYVVLVKRIPRTGAAGSVPNRADPK